MTTEAAQVTDLAAESDRLRALYRDGRLDEVVDAVLAYHATAGTAGSWEPREAVLAIGATAAREAGRWTEALELNAAVLRSQEDRQAGAVERAVTRFNDYDPLARTGGAVPARELLLRCHDVFVDAHDPVMTANTLSALADVDARLGHLNRAVEQEIEALRHRYAQADPEPIAAGHFNIANYLIRGQQDAKDVWAHGLAAAVVHYQADSPRFTTSLELLGRLIGRGDSGFAPDALSFDDVCVLVDRVGDIRFAELFARLPERAASGQAAVDEILRLTTHAREAAIEQAVDAWDPIISAMVTAQRPDAPAEIGALVDELLSEMRQETIWNELVIVLYRMQAGPEYHTDHTVADLDPVSSAVARRARAALTGEVAVDPDAWRALVEG